MTKNNIVNELVMEIKESEKDGMEYNLAYAELFDIVMRETIEPKVESFSRQLRGDVSEGVSEGCDLLMELVEKWDGTGNFHTLYKASLDNRLINLVTALGRNIRSHNTSYNISLSDSAKGEAGGEASPMMEILDDESLITRFDVTKSENSFEEMFNKFSKQYPNQAKVISLLLSFPDDYKKSDETKEICEFYGVDEYTNAIMKRVSRARLAFRKFVETNKPNCQVTV